MLFILRHYIKGLLHACDHQHFSNCMSTVNVIMHLPASYKLTCMDKFMYMQACLVISIISGLLQSGPECTLGDLGLLIPKEM